MNATTRHDPVTLQVIKDALTAIGQEMFQVMIRTSMSLSLIHI